MNSMVKKYGKTHQLIKVIEEANEFSHAVARYINNPSESNKYSVKEEMSDVAIMLEQAMVILDIKNSELEMIKEYKLEIQSKRMSEDIGDR